MQQILNLEHNQIETIEPDTFAAMNNLHTLILSHNLLSFVDATSLNGLFVLSLLSIDNNNISGIHPSAFHNCSGLTGKIRRAMPLQQNNFRLKT